MRDIQEIKADVARINDEHDKLRNLPQTTGRNERQLRLDKQLSRLMDELNEHREADLQRARKAAQDPRNIVPGSPQPSEASREINGWDAPGAPWEHLRSNLPSLQSAGDVRSRALAAIEQTPLASDTARDTLTDIVERSDSRDARLARQILLTTDPDYVAAFTRMFAGDQHLLTQREVEAVRRVRDEARAMSLTDGAGGFMVPAQLDPAIIITGAGSQDGIAAIARNEIATGDQWTGVSAAQVTSSWDAEASEVSDDSPTLTQPTVDVHMARTFVPFSIEVGMDASDFATQVARVMADSQLNLEREAFATGSGTGEPFGIVTELAGGAQEVASATTDTFALEDIYNVYGTLGARYRDTASWVANELIYAEIRQFDTQGGAALWAQLGEGRPGGLLGRPAVASSFFDGTIDALSDNRVLVFGDFSNYVIARRVGFTIELVPHLFATGANRPSGQRGYFGYSRLGAASVNDSAFVLLNIT